MTRRELALLLLREAGPRGVTTAEFLDGGVGSRYSARVRELRQQGHPITSERLREGSWRYTLVDADVGGGGLEASRTTREPGSYPLATADVGTDRLFSTPDVWDEVLAKDRA